MTSVLNGLSSFHTAQNALGCNLIAESRDALEMASAMPLEAVGILCSVDMKPYST